MINRNNKKGFTIVELVIVIAVIAILAAVLIPTFSGIIKKANISKDTQLAKNLNTILLSEEAEGNKPENFSDVLAVLRANGYIVENLNPTTEGYFFVWESNTNQIILVDDEYQVEYSSKDLESYNSIGLSWFFAVKDAELVASIKTAGGSVIPAVDSAWIGGDAAKVKELLTKGGVVTLSEPITLTVPPKHATVTGRNDAIRVVGTTVTYNLAGQTMTATTDFNVGFDDTGYALLHVGAEGNLVLEDGTIVASVKKVSNTGLSLYGVVRIFDGAVATVENMNIVYNGADNGTNGAGSVFTIGDTESNTLGTTLTVKNTVVTVANSMGAEIGGGTATFENVTFKNSGDGAWNDICVGVSYGGTANIKSGTYVAADGGMYNKGACVGVLPTGGTLNISGGTFEGSLYLDANDGTTATINITGGTFNGKSFNSLTEAEWRNMLVGCSAAEKEAVVITGAQTSNVTIKLAK